MKFSVKIVKSVEILEKTKSPLKAVPRKLYGTLISIFFQFLKPESDKY